MFEHKDKSNQSRGKYLKKGAEKLKETSSFSGVGICPSIGVIDQLNPGEFSCKIDGPALQLNNNQENCSQRRTNKAEENKN